MIGRAMRAATMTAFAARRFPGRPPRGGRGAAARTRLRGVLLAALACGAGTVCAQGAADYPNRPLRLVVPFPAGGGIDGVTRILQPRLTEALGQSMLIDNRTGAGGTVGTDIVAKANPDGYTVLMTFSSHAMNPALYPKLPYDTVRDLAGVTQMATVPNILVVNPSVAAKTVQEFIALAKAQPGKLLYASPGSGTPAHLVAELFKLATGTQMTHVPYKGGAPSMIALIANETQLTFTTVVLATPHVRSGKLRGIAVTSATRAPTMPELPTLRESGVKGADSVSWYAAFVPARTPAPVMSRLHGALVKALREKDVRDSLANLGADVVGGTPAEADAMVRDEVKLWTGVVKATGAKVD
jgi:tripartite-type tricarboxylate transporter receptor subunit TctC